MHTEPYIPLSRIAPEIKPHPVVLKSLLEMSVCRLLREFKSSVFEVFVHFNRSDVIPFTCKLPRREALAYKQSPSRRLSFSSIS